MDAVTLANRLWRKTPFGYSGAWFSHGGQSIHGFAALIECVMERYARRFGKVSNDTARRLHERLAAKYCNSNASTLRALRGPGLCGYVYPGRECSKLDEPILGQQWALMNLERQYAAHELDYCPINQSRMDHCECCGRVTDYEIAGRFGVMNRVCSKVCLNGWAVCRDRRCRAVAAYTKRGRGKLPLINVLLELAKNGKNNTTYKRGLEKHFVRHA